MKRHDHDAGGDPDLLRAKASLRDEVWTALIDGGVSRFPGARNRISNFTGSEAAADRLRATEAWAASIVGATRSARRVGVADLEPVDLVVTGCVAVGEDGARLGGS